MKRRFSMKASFKKTFTLFLIATFVLSLFGVVLRSFLLFTSYDAALGYFDSGALTDLLFPLLFVIAAILYAAFGFLARAEFDKDKHEATVAVTFSSAFAAIATAVWFISNIPLAFSAESPTERIFSILMLLCTIGLSVHFVLTTLGTGSLSLRVFSHVSAILFCVFYILHAYFDVAFVLNSPVKIFDQITILCFALFFIAECRFLFGTAHNAVYVPITMLAATFAAADSIPALLYAAKEGKALMGNVMHDFMVFSLFLYASARLLAILFIPEKIDMRGVYAEEIDRSNEEKYLPDTDTHIVSYDPDQQAFDFGSDMGDGESDASGKSTSDEKNDEDAPTEDFDIAQTTLDFKRHS